MKIINLNESQFGRLLENGIENYGQSNTKEFQTPSEVVTTSKITDKNGDTEDSNPIKDIGPELTTQVGFAGFKASSRGL